MKTIEEAIMKTEKQITEEIGYYETRLLEDKATHAQLNQIDCLSGVGSQLRKRMAKIEGKIEALKWVLA